MGERSRKFPNKVTARSVAKHYDGCDDGRMVAKSRHGIIRAAAPLVVLVLVVFGVVPPRPVVASGPGTITTFAGGGHADEGVALASAGISPGSVALDGLGNLYVTDEYSCRVRKASGGVLNTVVGQYQTPNSVNSFCNFGGDGGPATGALLDPSGIVVSGTNIYVADTRSCRVRLVSAEQSRPWPARGHARTTVRARRRATRSFIRRDCG